MGGFFVHIYTLLRNRRWLFVLLSALSLGLILAGAWRIRFVEDIGGSRQAGEKSSLYEKVTGDFRFTEKLVIHIYLSGDGTQYSADSLCLAADSLGKDISEQCKDYVASLFVKTSDTLIPYLMAFTRDYFPLFLDSADYPAIDSMVTDAAMKRSVDRAYRQLVTPASFAISRQILGDPLGIQGLAMRKLKNLEGNPQYESYGGYVMSRDRKHLLMFLIPLNPPGETGRNGIFLQTLDRLISLRFDQGSRIKAEYFGAAAVAVGNAERLKKDILLSLAIAIIAIFLLIGLYFRSFKVPMLGLLPAFFGGGMAIAVLAFTKGSVSAIALGIGSVILGLIIDYSLYLINHYRRCGNLVQALKEMSQSIVVCALTSAGAFLCLVFLESSVLHDLGWFASLSVAGAAVFALVFLPQLLPGKFIVREKTGFAAWIDRIGEIAFQSKPALIIIIFVLLLVSFFFYKRAGFETDMNALNFMEPSLKDAGEKLDSLSNGKLRNIYIVSAGNSKEAAFRVNDIVQARLAGLREEDFVKGVSGIGTLLFSDSLDRLRIARWNQTFSAERKIKIVKSVEEHARLRGFSPGAFREFSTLMEKDYAPPGPQVRAGLEKSLFSEWVSTRNGLFCVSCIASVKPEHVQKIYGEFSGMKDVVVFDRLSIASQFVERVRRDFEKLVLLSMVFVSLLLWISFGRIELALITALPMYASWLITLGFMGFTGIRFNIFNIIISSFIFGLGVDYSILMMRGIMLDFKYRTHFIPTYRVSVLLSSATTLFGVAALFTARHPALNSIALISVFGISVLVLLTFSIQPMVAQWFMGSRLEKNKFPITARIFVKSIITWFNIVFIAFILAITGSLMYFLLPLKRRIKEELFHRMFCSLSRFYIFLVFPDRKLYNPQGEDFRKPAVIISNHQSLIETPAMLRLYPKIIILTTTWVYNSPVFGPIARLASFYNVDQGIDVIMDKLKQKVNEGYSILIFPEAHRSRDLKIQRFHRGAFYLAEKLGLDILPMMMFGSGDFLQAGEFWGRPGIFRQKIYPRIAPDDSSFGATYQERVKAFRRFYVREYEHFKSCEGTPSYYRRKLCLNYVYKGPVLEWYVKSKLKLENNYELLNSHLPRKGEILDLGCGYGVISHMLSMSSPDRMITGVDYDSEKIRVASSGFLLNPNLSFHVSDVMEWNIRPSDAFILSDVLHYLTASQQDLLLQKCMDMLRPDGVIIVRDADGGIPEKHFISVLTELFSTRSGFNKTGSADKALHFLSAMDIEKVALRNGFSMEIIGIKKRSSNKYYLLKKTVSLTADHEKA